MSRTNLFVQNLSKLTPSLKDVDPSKLSKHVVLDESIALHKSQQQKLSASMRQVDSLLAERDEILAELNQWRSSFGLNPRQPTALPPMPEEKEPKTRTFSAGSGSAPQFDTRASMSAPAGGGASSLPGPGMAEWEESPTSLDGQYYSGGEPPSASFPILDNTIEGGLPIAAASASVSKQPAPDPSWDALTLPIASSDGGGMNPMAHPPPAHLSSTPNPFIHGNLGDLHPRDYGMGGMPFDAGHMQMPMVNHLGVLEGIHEQRGV